MDDDLHSLLPKVTLMLTFLALSACAPRTAPPTPAIDAPVPSQRPRNVILFIGDGMGPGQVGLLQLYARKAPNAVVRPPTSFDRMSTLGAVGLSMHDPADYLVTDSACSATQLALGVPAPVEAIGIDAEGTPRDTVLEVAHAKGLATGLVSDTRLTHATPASFAAHSPHRRHENDIAEQMLSSGADVLLSGGRRHFVPQTVEGSKRSDDLDLLTTATEQGFTVVQDRTALQQAPEGKLLGLFSNSGMLDAITDHATRDAPTRTEPSLEEMSDAALTHLSNDDDGFFLMIEAGQVDWAGHTNDAGWLLHEMVKVDETLKTLITYVESHPDTLLLVTADHETGGFGLGYHRAPQAPPPAKTGSAYADEPFAPAANYGEPAVLDTLYSQKAPWEQILGAADADPSLDLAEAIRTNTEFSVPQDAVERALRTGPDLFHDGEPEDVRQVPFFEDFAAFYPARSYGRAAQFGRMLATQQSAVWATGGHTHQPVPVFAVGPGQQAFGRFQHHTDIGAWLQNWARSTPQ